jgi:hypothetical protein
VKLRSEAIAGVGKKRKGTKGFCFSKKKFFLNEKKIRQRFLAPRFVFFRKFKLNKH